MIGHYFNNSASTQTDVDNAQQLFDKDGVPFLRIKGVGDVYNPAGVGVYALKYAGLETYDNDKTVKEDIKKFRACVKWLKDNLKHKNDYWVWEYTFDSTYNDVTVKAPWYSAFGQATGIEALLASYKIDGNKQDLKVAEKAARVLFVPIDKGGLLYQKHKDIWFEEIAVPVNNPPHILNGHMRTLIAIKKLADASGNKDYQDWYNRGLDTLEKWLPLYDTGYWLKYDLNPKKSELLFRFNNPYGFALPNLAIDSITLRDPVNHKECTLDVGAQADPQGSLRISGNDWGQQEVLDGKTIRRLKPVTPATSQEELSGEIKAPGTFFYLKLPSDWNDNLRSEDYELEIKYKDEAQANITVQMRSIAPGPAFRDMRDGDLLLTGSGKWRSWKIPLRTADMGWWVGSSYAEKHALYLNKLAKYRPSLKSWALVVKGYYNFLFENGYKTKKISRQVFPKQTPMLPIYSIDKNGVVVQHMATERTKFLTNGGFDPSGDRGVPVYQVYVIAAQLLEGNNLAGGAYSSGDVDFNKVRREPALNWLLNKANFRTFKDSAVYYFDFPNAYNDVYTSSHWQSAFSQAYILKALSFAADSNLGGTNKIKSQLAQAANAFKYNLKTGGVVTTNRINNRFAEEVPNATHVLNAHLVSTTTLADINRVLQSKTIRDLTAEFRKGLKANISSYDTGYWSRYDQNPKKEILFQIDWLNGSHSPLIDEIYLENPQTGTASNIDVGEKGDFEGYPCLTGTDWTNQKIVDNKTVRAFANGYDLRDEAVNGGARHNVFFLGALPERQFDDYFDIPPHRLIIKYKDVAKGEFIIKTQAINEGNYLAFTPLRGGILRCTGDGKWKEAVFTVRPQDMGWYMGEDYQKFHIEQLQELYQQTGDCFFAQYAEKWQYYLDDFKNKKSVIMETQDKGTAKDMAPKARVVKDLPSYKGYGIVNALDGDPNDDYVAGLENGLPASFSLAFAKAERVKQIDLIWESESNYGKDYDILSISSDGNEAKLITTLTNQKGKIQRIVLPQEVTAQGLKITVKKTAGQKRVLLRQIKVF